MAKDKGKKGKKEIPNTRKMAIKLKLNTALKDKSLGATLETCARTTSKATFATDVHFHLYVMEALDKGEDFEINNTVLGRCANMSMTGSKPFTGTSKAPKKATVAQKAKAAERTKAAKKNIAKLKEIRTKYHEIFDKMPVQYFPAATRPLENFHKIYMANIENHITLNFYKFQQRYIKAMIEKVLTTEYPRKIFEKKLFTSKQYGLLTWLVQRTLHKPNVKMETESKLINKTTLEKVMPHLLNVLKSVAKSVPTSIYENISSKNLKENLKDLIRYFSHMSKYLQSIGKSAFSPLPNVGLGRHHMHIDKRFMHRIYNKHYNEKIEQRDFEVNFKKHYDRMFNFKVMFKDKPYYPEYMVTDGFSISIILDVPSDVNVKKTSGKKKSTKKKKNENNKETEEDAKQELIVLDSTVHTKGLFDASQMVASQKTIDEYIRTAIDPGNGDMLHCVQDNWDNFVITKGYYNEISHITRNMRKKQRMMENSPVQAINETLSAFRIRTANIVDYEKYMRCIGDNWEALWDFYLNPSLVKMDFDTYLHSQKAIATICRKIIGKARDRKGLPHMIAFGKGNGSITVSNTRNSSAHGPIKRIAYALSEHVLVLLVDENMTSQICSGCHVKMEHPVTHHHRKYKKIVKDMLGRYPKSRKEYNFLKSAFKVPTFQHVEKRKSYGLCCCKNTNPSREHRRWNRNFNAGRNINEVLKRELQGLDLGPFKRTKTE
jgi:hypothetical protein